MYTGTGTKFSTAMEITNYLSKSCLLYFFMIRTFEDEILLYFMNFQKMFRLEELQIVREEYVKYEKDMYKRHKIAAVTLMTLLTITFILDFVFSPANAIAPE